MRESFSFSERDEGKRVVDARGEQIGIVADVRSGMVYIDSDPSLTDTVKSKLGWNEADEETYPLDTSTVETITDDEIRLTDFGTW